MQIDFKKEVAAVMTCLEQSGYAARTLNDHRRCCDELRKLLSDSNKPFSMEAAISWLEKQSIVWSRDTYERYRRAVYRIDKYIKSGSIEREPHCHNNYFAYHDTDVSYINLPYSYKAVYCDFYETISGERAKGTVEHYVAGCTDFLQFMAGQGCAAPAEMTIELPIGYLRRIRENTWSFETKLKYAEGVGQLLMYLSRQGHIPLCYAHVMRKLEDEAAITSLKLSAPNHTGTDFQPSKELESYADSFLSNLDERRYSEPPQQMFGFIFRNFFQFLEINHLPFSTEATQKWLNHIPKTTSWELKRQIITWFANFMETGSAERASCFVWKPLLIDTLIGKYPCILLHGKGNKERRISLTDKTVGHLKQYLQTFHAESPQDADLFSTTIKGTTSAMSPGNVQRIIKKYTQIARIDCSDIPNSVHPHMFRRTRATDLYQDGVPIELVSTILGHAKVETTKEHYAKPSLAQMRESMASVPTPTADEEPLWLGSEDEMARACGLR